MKRIAISVVLLLGLAAMCFWSVGAVDISVDELLGEIERVERGFSDGKSGEYVSAAEDVINDWGAFLKRAFLINDPDLASDITVTVSELLAYAERGSEELLAACARARAQLELLKNAQEPTVRTVL